MGGLAGILGNPVLVQLLLYNVVGQLIGAALGPFQIAVANQVNQLAPNVVLSPADLADAVIRNIVQEPDVAAEAAASGVNAERFHTLTLLAGNAPDPTSLAIALRRQLIDAPTYDRGIRQGRLRDEWADLVRELAVVQPTPMDALTAQVEHQLDPGTAHDKFVAFGGDPAQYDWLVGTVGAGPSPLEAAAMAHRGLIPWGGTGLGVVSFDQAVAEGHSRDKWTVPYRGLADYLPPPRTITAMHKEGALTDAQATKLLEDHGVPADLIGAYLAAATAQRLTKPKELAEATVLRLYADKLIARPDAANLLGKLSYPPAEAEFILEVADLAAMERAVTAAVGRIHTLYVGHKIPEATALTTLAALDIGAKEAGELVTIWGHERAANVRQLTAAQIASALADSIIDQPTAMAMLEADGYTPYDAWLVLSVHAKVALPDQPPADTLPAPAGP